MTPITYTLAHLHPFLSMVRYSVHELTHNRHTHSLCRTGTSLAIGVLMLVLIDLVILIVYCIVEGVHGSLTVARVANREDPIDVKVVGLCPDTLY